MITIQREILSEILSKCLRLTKKQHVLNQLACVKIVIDESGMIIISATDLETGMTFSVKSSESESDLTGFLVRCDKLFALVAALKCETVSLKTTKASLHVEGDGITGNFILPLTSGDLPTFKKNTDEKAFTFEWDNSDRLLQRNLSGFVVNKQYGNGAAAITAFSVKKGSTSAENYEFCAANTDGYLGAIERVDAVADGNNVSPRTGDTPVTFELLHEQVRLLAEIEGILTVSVNSKSVRCCRKKENLSIEIFFIRPAEDKKAIADTVRENLDNMLKLMKSSFNGRIAVNKKDLLEAVNRILICATAGGDIKRDYMLSMDMAFSGDSLKVSHHDTGTEETITDIGFEGKCGILRFNPNILKRILTEHGDVVEFSYESESISETGTLNVVAVEDQDNEKYNGFIAGRI